MWLGEEGKDWEGIKGHKGEKEKDERGREKREKIIERVRGIKESGRERKIKIGNKKSVWD